MLWEFYFINKHPIINMCFDYSRVFLVVLILAMSRAYVPVRPMSQSPWYGTRNDASCRESIEDLKALIEVTNCLRNENNSYTCDTCGKTFNEELILKLINALVLTATRNCGYDGYHQQQGGHNIGVWNAGGGYMGGNTILVGAPHHQTSTLQAPETVDPTDKIENTLVDLGVLDGKNAVSLDVGNKDVLKVNAGNIVGDKSTTSARDKSTTVSSKNNGKPKDDGLVNVGVLDEKITAGVGGGGVAVKVANVDETAVLKDAKSDVKLSGVTDANATVATEIN